MGRKNASTSVGTLPLPQANRLAADNLRLAWKFIRREARKGRIDAIELESLIMLALVRASRTFKPAKGFAFSTWAFMIFKNAVLTYHKSQSHDCRRIWQHQVAYPRQQEDGRPIALADPTDFAARANETHDRRELLAAALTALTPREYQILVWRFVDGLTLIEIGQKLNLTRERIRQIQHQALGKCLKRVGTRAGDRSLGMALTSPFLVQVHA